MSETRSDSQNISEGAGYPSTESEGYSSSGDTRRQRSGKAPMPVPGSGKGLMGLGLSESSQLALQKMPINWPADLEELPWSDHRRYRYYKAWIANLGRNYRALPFDDFPFDLPSYAGGRASAPRLPSSPNPDPNRPFTVTPSGNHVEFSNGERMEVINPESLLVDDATSGWDPKSIMTIDELEACEAAEREVQEEEEEEIPLKRQRAGTSTSTGGVGSSRAPPIYGKDAHGRVIKFFPAKKTSVSPSGGDDDEEEEEEDVELLNLAAGEDDDEPQPSGHGARDGQSSNTTRSTLR